jgi:hypothetical protein
VKGSLICTWQQLDCQAKTDFLDTIDSITYNYPCLAGNYKTKPKDRQNVSTPTQKKDSEETRVITVTLDSHAARNLRVLGAEIEISAPNLIREAIAYWWEQKHRAKRGELSGSPSESETVTEAP